MRVQVLLKTPLYRGKYGPDHDSRLRASIVEVRGIGTSRDGGLDIEVSSLHDGDGVAVVCPIERLFLPSSKIDFYVIESGAEA